MDYINELNPKVTKFPFFKRKGIEVDHHHAMEVINHDCYQLERLKAQGFNPNLIFDLGASCGDFAAYCDYLWRGVRVLSFDGDPEIQKIFPVNAPTATLIAHNVIGCTDLPVEDLYFVHDCQREEHKVAKPHHKIRGYIADALDLYGSDVDLLKVDTEGCEVNLIRDLDEDRADYLNEIKVIVGEWHYKPALDYLEKTLSKTHNFTARKATNWNLFTATRKDLNLDISIHD